MKFEIDFNRIINNKLLEELGAKLETCGSEDLPYDCYMIELNTFEELEELLKKVDSKTNDIYSAVISFDSPTIFLDANT